MTEQLQIIEPAEITIGAADNRQNVIMEVYDKGRDVRSRIPIQPGVSVMIAKAIFDRAIECGAEIIIDTPRFKVSTETRDKLIQRVALMSGSMINRGKTPGQMALEIVDIVLREIA